MPDFQIDIKKVNWVPKHVADIADVASRAFEAPISFEELKVVGTDHIEKIPMRSDEDIPKFLAIKAKTRFHESVIRFKIPERIVAQDFVPKKVKVLARGRRTAKFFGENQVSTRQVEFSLKLFDCGHFYLKQTLPGSGASPYWVIFEGRWQRTDKGLLLEYLLRYAWQLTKNPRSEDFAIEAVPAGHRSRLAWCGDIPEQQLNGSLPAIVGEEQWCWVEICREPDVVEQSRARFNEEPDDAVPAPAPAPPREPNPEVLPQRPSAAAAATCEARHVPEEHNLSKGDDEQLWPMLLGCALFLALFLGFMGNWWAQDGGDEY